MEVEVKKEKEEEKVTARGGGGGGGGMWCHSRSLVAFVFSPLFLFSNFNVSLFFFSFLKKRNAIHVSSLSRSRLLQSARSSPSSLLRLLLLLLQFPFLG